MRSLSGAETKAEDDETWLVFVSWTASSATRLAGVSSSSISQNPHRISSIAPHTQGTNIPV